MQTTITPVSCKYGAPMGRRTQPGDPSGERIHLRRVRIDCGGYDSGGAYWGLGQPLFEAFTPNGDWSTYFRARDRDAAKAAVREDYPDVKFFR
jgi:hypothetical protein